MWYHYNTLVLNIDNRFFLLQRKKKGVFSFMKATTVALVYLSLVAAAILADIIYIIVSVARKKTSLTLPYLASHLVPCMFLCAGGLFVVGGIFHVELFSSELDIIYDKAVTICLSCMGFF